jgi:L-fuconolactonase
LPDFPIVDAHVHIHDPGRLTYPWLASVPSLNRPHLPSYYSERSAPVVIDKYVFVEFGVLDRQKIDEALFVTGLSQEDPRLSAIVAGAALENGIGAEPQVAALARLPLVRAIRRLIQEHPEPGWCLRPGFVEGVSLLARYNLGFDICIRHSQMTDAIELVKRCPETRFMLDHIGKPDIKGRVIEPWRGLMQEFARLPNVMCKISGVTDLADHKTWTYDQLAHYIIHSLECFGFDRCAFGSDWSISEFANTLPDWVSIVDRVTSGESTENLRKLYRDTAIRFYRL